MAYNILFTSLYAAGKDEPLRYYYAKEGDKRVYADAMLTVEATTEYILSRQHIDEILILGRELTFDTGDEKRALGVDDGKSFYVSDFNDLSTYSLFRYRIAQFIDGLNIEQQDLLELLSPEEQAETEAFIKDFFNRAKGGNDFLKFSKFFDRLAQDQALFDTMRRELSEAIPDAEDKLGKYLRWIKNYLYMNLKDTSKMEILDGNEDAIIKFVPTAVDESGKLPIDTLIEIVNGVAAEHETVDIYIALNNDDMTDNFVLLSLLDILDAMYSSEVTVRKVYTATDAHYKMAGMIRDDSEGYGMSALVSATRAFLRYGKVDMIVDYWENSLSKNHQVEKMIYAMRRIDIGLSLCCVGDIIEGISDLRALFRDGFDLSNSDYYSKLFMLMSEGIKKDYGRLVTEDDAGFIDLVKWAYSKGFYQQCLTLIEARATRDIISKGIFYYCGSDEEKQHVADLFGSVWNDLRPFDRWKMNDVDHYFIKTYKLFKHSPKSIDDRRANARDLLTLLDNTDPDVITALTVCDDRQALEDLIFAYYHVGFIRNDTNHASDRSGGKDTLFPDDKEVSELLIQIQESIEYFIQTYDRVLELIAGKDPYVVRINTEEVKSAGRRLEREHDKEKAES